MAHDSDTHEALLSDALKLAETGSVSAAADALRSALEVDFQPDVAAVLAHFERYLSGGGGDTAQILAELRDIVQDDDDFFGSDLIVEDPATQSETPVDTDAVPPPAADPFAGLDPFETAPRKPAEGPVSERTREETAEPSVRRGSLLDKLDDVPDAPSKTAGSETRGARYRGTAPPPPSHRRRGAERPAPTPRQPTPPEPADDLDDFDLFGGGPTSGSHLDIEPEVVTDSGAIDALAGGGGPRSQSDTAPTPAAGRVRRPTLQESGAQTAVGRPVGRGDADAKANASTPAGGSPVTPSASSKETGRIRPVDNGPERRLPVAMLIDRAKNLMGRGDLASAAEIIGEALNVEPGHGEALRLRDDLNHRLGVLRMDALEPLDRVPTADLGAAQGAPQLGQRAMYLLTMVDGSLSLQDLIDLSGVPALEAATLLSELIELGALRFD